VAAAVLEIMLAAAVLAAVRCLQAPELLEIRAH
jgi:hypothetical protein